MINQNTIKDRLVNVRSVALAVSRFTIGGAVVLFEDVMKRRKLTDFIRWVCNMMDANILV